MKKTIIIALLAIGLVSCKKETKCYTCFYPNTTQMTDFCGTKQELDTYLKFKNKDGRTFKCQ